jgi:phenylpropionate dioxygenase-like ring-hydroxylating dioxygenase large terminal subunit
VRNPFSDHIPRNAKVTSYPVVARHGLVWFWPGDPWLADRVDSGFLVLDGQDVGVDAAT